MSTRPDGTDSTKDHPLFGADPLDYMRGRAWRQSVPKASGPIGEWRKLWAIRDCQVIAIWVWDEKHG